MYRVIVFALPNNEDPYDIVSREYKTERGARNFFDKMMKKYNPNVNMDTFICIDEDEEQIYSSMEDSYGNEWLQDLER